MILPLRAKQAARTLGRRGEKAAASYLEACGMTLLAKNFRCKAGELDLVALDGREIVFVEVKTLRARPGFLPAGNLSLHQRRRNMNAAKVYLKMIDSPPLGTRFDLVELLFRGPFLLALRRTEDYLPPLPPPVPEKKR